MVFISCLAMLNIYYDNRSIKPHISLFLKGPDTGKAFTGPWLYYWPYCLIPSIYLEIYPIMFAHLCPPWTIVQKKPKANPSLSCRGASISWNVVVLIESLWILTSRYFRTLTLGEPFLGATKARPHVTPSRNFYPLKSRIQSQTTSNYSIHSSITVAFA